ncbi:sugar phosphate isomerase/epimerase [Candidatus Poribacteria bacterium]|nr:MAG: sugar phosphate isomerase/epimerase [Candidatus Poribacteria bacterium]
MGFVLGINTSTIRPAPLLDKIKIAADAGFEAIELWNDELTEFEREVGSLDKVVQELERNNLKVATVIALKGWIESKGEEYRRALEEARRRMEQAAAVGSPYIIASPPRGKVEDMDEAARRYRELLELGKEIGVKPAMEFLGFVEGIYKIEHAWYIVERSGHPDGTIVMDTFHIFRGGSSFEQVKEIPADRIAVFHFNDAPAQPERAKQTDADRVFPGDGILPLKEVAGMLREMGYEGVVSLELFNPRYWEMPPEEVAKTGMRKMREVLRVR